tara:strand:- start:34537 stop:35586 length:1050 start_codon:yes stop_codon:yes gene_type:complete
MKGKKIKVLIIDDSKISRTIIKQLLTTDPKIEVIGEAQDPYIAKEKIFELKPDVITLDVDMPRMDGITFLKILMEQMPMPVIIISKFTPKGSELALEALEAGALDALGKPDEHTPLDETRDLLIEKVKGAAASKLFKPIEPKEPLELPKEIKFNSKQVIVIGASMGGVEAIKALLKNLPKNMPGICIVQHIPPYFSKALANRLNSICSLNVKEAQNNDKIEPGQVLIAPGDYHITLEPEQTSYKVRLSQGPLVFHQRPSVDVLFKATAKCAGKNAIGVILTGMGCDGAEGLLELHQSGAKTFSQSKETCAVYGMPQYAEKRGGVQETVSLNSMGEAILKAITQADASEN